MPDRYYRDKLYPFQDEVLEIIKTAEVDFYLTGGTALCRCYLMHRYSDDLDFFLNAHSGFKDQSRKIISLFKEKKLSVTISTASDAFVRLFLQREDVLLKIDFVNDVPFHYGPIENTCIFSKVDNWRNILSNKICALSRMEPKDMADILFIAHRHVFSWEDILDEAKEKDLWVDPVEVCRVISEFQPASLKTVKWVSAIDIEKIGGMIKPLHNDIFFGNNNSLTSYELN